MAILAAETKEMGFQLEQVQDFTPTPMTVATEIYYSGYHPYTLQKVYTPKTEAEKREQNRFFFWYQQENRDWVREKLKTIKRPDLIERLLEEKPKGDSNLPKWLAEKRNERVKFKQDTAMHKKDNRNSKTDSNIGQSGKNKPKGKRR